MSKYTPGPWRWELNMKSKNIQLCGGKPQYDLTVMDFRRWGTSGARPRVLDFSDMMLLREAEDFRVVVPGREHHASWFQGLNHPDLNLIAAAPELLAALRSACENYLSQNGSKPPAEWLLAVAKAEGRV